MFAWSSCCRKKGKLTPRVEETRVARNEEVTERAEERRKKQARLQFSPEKPHGDRRQPCPGLGTCKRLLALCPFSPSKCLPGGSDGTASACNAGDLGSISGSRRPPGEGNGNPLQDSCLENSMDGGAWWATVHGVAKSRTQLSDFTFPL